MSIPNTISFDSISNDTTNTFTNFGLHWVSGGTVGSTYNGTDTLLYDFREGSQYQGRTIKYVAGVWSDDNLSAFPDTVVSNNNSATVTLQTAFYGTVTFVFTNPFYSSAPPPGDTETESSTAVTSATLGLDNNGNLAAFVTAGSPSGDFTIYEGSTLRNSFTHTTLTASLVNATSWSSTNNSTWYLKNSYGDVLDTYGGKKKVFCNFW